MLKAPIQPPRIFRILSTASKGFLKKNNTPTNRKIFPFFIQTLRPQPPTPQPPIFALNLAYTDNWTHLQHNASKITICIYLVLTFFLDHHIFVLEVVNENLFDVLVGLFCRGQTKNLSQLLLSLQVVIFFGKTNPLFAVSPLLCDWDFSPKVFPICCLKTTPTLIFQPSSLRFLYNEHAMCVLHS